MAMRRLYLYSGIKALSLVALVGDVFAGEVRALELLFVVHPR